MKIKDLAFVELSDDDSRVLGEIRGKRGTLVVHERVPGAEAATAIDAREDDTDVVVLVDDDDSPSGLLVPDDFLEVLARNKGIEVESLRAAVDELQADAEEVMRGFRHEWLRSRRPSIKYCGACGFVTRDPCKKHG